jgi:hypothetical protein
MSSNGAIRSLIQAAISAALAFGPMAALIDWAGWDITPAQVTMAVMPVVMGLYWQLGNWAQSNATVKANPALRMLTAIAMGGRTAPSYTPDEG